MNDDFYNDSKDKKEFMHPKNGRTLFLSFIYEGKILLVPLRTNLPIKSRHNIKSGFISPTTNRPNAGLDYTKLIFTNMADIKSTNIIIDREQRKHILENEEKIRKEIIVFINEYKEMINKGVSNNLVKYVYRYTTLQYYHKELGLDIKK